jgi:hypothetical protein
MQVNLISLSRNSMASHQHFTAFLVRLAGGEVLASGEGAGGGVWGDDGGANAMGVAGGCQTGGSAAYVTRQSARVDVCDGDDTHQLRAATSAAMDDVMRREEIFTSWLPAWRRKGIWARAQYPRVAHKGRENCIWLQLAGDLFAPSRSMVAQVGATLEKGMLTGSGERWVPAGLLSQPSTPVTGGGREEGGGGSRRL